jgi:hypothetical protein
MNIRVLVEDFSTELLEGRTALPVGTKRTRKGKGGNVVTVVKGSDGKWAPFRDNSKVDSDTAGQNRRKRSDKRIAAKKSGSDEKIKRFNMKNARARFHDVKDQVDAAPHVAKKREAEKKAFLSSLKKKK